MKSNIPSIDPADNDSLVGALKFIINKMMLDNDDMLPATVIAYDNGFVQVQPLIYIVGTSGEQVSRAQFAKIPVLALGGGSFVLSFPVKPGDFGFIKANDRDISIFMQSLKESEPGTVRHHSFSDAVFIPHVFSGYSIDPENMVMQNLAGTVKISLGVNTIDITAPTVNINGSPSVNVSGANLVKIDSANVDVDGTTAVTIDSDVEVTITAPVVDVNGTIF